MHMQARACLLDPRPVRSGANTPPIHTPICTWNDELLERQSTQGQKQAHLSPACTTGLSLGLLALDVEQVKALRAGTKGSSRDDQRRAARVYPLIRRQHWLLVTLLLW